MNQRVLVLDFGGQYNQLIARRVRDMHVYCEMKPYTMTLEEIRAFDPIGIIFTGGPSSVGAEGSPRPAEGIFELGIPILGICYGCQLMAQLGGGAVGQAEGEFRREYGKTVTQFDTQCALFAGTPAESVTWMSHGDSVQRLPEGFVVTARSANCPIAGIACAEKKFYGVQFHPEVNHTAYGRTILHNFLYDICGAAGDWSMGDYCARAIEEIRRRVGDGKVLLGLSGGVDSSVCAALLTEAVGEHLTCVFVDHGLLRLHEADQVEEAFAGRAMNFVRVDASERFLSKLAGVTDPERKRKIIGEEFIRVFEAEARKIGHVDFLAQGTIYADVIESGVGKGAAVIKSHHNVGGLPSVVDFKEIIEPLRLLFKDEVRQLGRELGLPESLVNRQPFPGPGLAIRCIGEITAERLASLRLADAIFREEVEAAGAAQQMSQYFAVLTNVRSVGVLGDGRSYDCAVALRAVKTDDFMTADWVRIPYEILERVSVRIVNEVPHVNRVLLDITSKPPATVEWE